MNSPYTPVTLAAQAAQMPELDGLSESEQEWGLGGMSFPRSDRPHADLAKPPSYRRGWTFRLPEDMRAVAINFKQKGGGRGVAVVLRTAGEEYLTGWFREARYKDAARAVDVINREIEAAWATWRSGNPAWTDSTAPNPPLISDRDADARVLTFEQGSEHAPDDPWGAQVLRLSTRGKLTYEHRTRGHVRNRRGTVDGERGVRAIAALLSTTFPEPAQNQFEPGASMIAISLDEPAGKIVIDAFDGLQYRGYDHVIGELAALNAALRTDDRAVLEAWQFREEA